jgi:protein SCO1/2
MSSPDHEPNTAPRKGRGRWTAIALSAVAGLAIGGGAYAWRAANDGPRVASVSQVVGQPAVGGPFQLVDQDGRPATEQMLRGKWSAVFFGYTSCPDFCPATLQTLQAASGKLGENADDLQVVLISVDPERDTPETLRSYLEGYEFPGGIRGLTGTPEQVAAATKAWRVYTRKREGTGGHGGHGYLVDHFTGVFLTNPQGEFVQVFTGELSPDEAARQIRAAMNA